MANSFPAIVRRLAVTVTILTLISSCASRSSTVEETRAPAMPIADLLKQADEGYAARGDTARARESQTLLRQARVAQPENYDAAWRMARISYVIGDDLTDTNAREQAFREGQEAGEAAVRVQPDKPEGHFWLAANLGGYAQTKGPLSGLASAKKLREQMEAVLKIDESYQGGSAYMALGQLDLELPELLGGDRKRAVATLEKGLRFGEQNSFLRLNLAQAYLAVGRPDDARKQLNFILNMKPSPDYLPEHKEAVAKARQLLDTRFSK